MTYWPVSARCKTEAGFSLIEMLIVLALFSIASLVLFQATSAQFRQIEAVDNAINRAFERTLAQRIPESIIKELIPSWPEQGVFSGDTTEMAGFTAYPLTSAIPRLSRFQLRLAPTDTGTDIYLQSETDDLNAKIAHLDKRVEFRYFGFDGAWRTSWPPQLDEAVFEEDTEAVFRMSQLPDFIALWDTGSDQFLTIISVENKVLLSERVQDIIGP